MWKKLYIVIYIYKSLFITAHILTRYSNILFFYEHCIPISKLAS